MRAGVNGGTCPFVHCPEVDPASTITGLMESSSMKNAIRRSALVSVFLFACAAVAQQIPANTRVAVRVNERCRARTRRSVIALPAS